LTSGLGVEKSAITSALGRRPGGGEGSSQPSSAASSSTNGASLYFSTGRETASGGEKGLRADSNRGAGVCLCAIRPLLRRRRRSHPPRAPVTRSGGHRDLEGRQAPVPVASNLLLVLPALKTETSMHAFSNTAWAPSLITVRCTCTSTARELQYCKRTSRQRSTRRAGADVGFRRPCSSSRERAAVGGIAASTEARKVAAHHRAASVTPLDARSSKLVVHTLLKKPKSRQKSRLVSTPRTSSRFHRESVQFSEVGFARGDHHTSEIPFPELQPSPLIVSPICHPWSPSSHLHLHLHQPSPLGGERREEGTHMCRPCLQRQPLRQAASDDVARSHARLLPYRGGSAKNEPCGIACVRVQCAADDTTGVSPGFRLDGAAVLSSDERRACRRPRFQDGTCCVLSCPRRGAHENKKQSTNQSSINDKRTCSPFASSTAFRV
jgi:hypothetical protein